MKEIKEALVNIYNNKIVFYTLLSCALTALIVIFWAFSIFYKNIEIIDPNFNLADSKNSITYDSSLNLDESSYTLNIPPSINIENPSPFSTEIVSFLKEENKIHNYPLIGNSDNYFYWISDDKYTVTMDNSEGYSLGVFGCTRDAERSIYIDNTKRIAHEISEILTKQGFVKNDNNTFNNLNDDIPGYYVESYTKDNIKAQFYSSTDCSSYDISDNSVIAYNFNFYISESYDAKYKEQIDYLKFLTTPNSDISASIEKVYGDFVKLSLGYRFAGGYAAIVKKTENGLVKIYEGQGATIECSILEKYDVPEEVFPSDYCM